MDNVYVKKISELPFLSELSGDAYIIVSDNGVMKRVLASDIAPQDIAVEQLNSELQEKIAEIDNKQDIVSDEDVVEQLAQADIINPVASNSGALFVNNSGKIFII